MKKLLLILLPLITISCSHHESTHPLKVTKARAFGAHSNLKSYGPLTFSGQISKADIIDLKNQNYKTIINLRGLNEFKKFNEKAYVEKNKMNYVQIPFFDKNKNINSKNLPLIHAEVAKAMKKGKTLIHCSSGNRASAWLGLHLYQDHGIEKEQAIKTAKNLGMTKSKMEKKLRSYMELN